jgi:uncharacterized protein YsxB (DUF464 family)
MITVVYHRDLNRVSIEGHAYSGEKGHDLVCASASILANTLASLVSNMQKAGQTRYPTIELSYGNALIQCNVASRYKPTVTFAFDSICAGFELLAQSYPDNISYEIRGKI